MSVSKDKKRGTWLYHGYYRDATNARRQYCRRGFETKREAKEAEHAFLEASAKVRPSITLDELVLRYHEEYEIMGIKEATLISNESYYRNHIRESLGRVQLSKFTAPLVTQFMSSVAKRKQKNGTPYSVATINKTKEVLSKYLSYAMRLGFIDYNPCMAVGRFKRPSDYNTKAPNFWEVKTFKYFLSFVGDPFWVDVFTFLFETGVREGEFFALQWSDVDLGAGTLSIKKTLTYKTLDRGWALTSPKTKNSIRRIDLQDSLLELLRRRYAASSCVDGFSSDFFVFGDVAPMSRQKLATTLDRYIRLAGVPRITPHGFRHSHASYLIRSGKIDDQLIADRLGHTVEEMRKTYAHIYEESRHDLKSILNEIF